MSDLGKVVQKLTETNVRLETLEKQNKESGTAASIIAASLPEVLSDRNVAKNRESFDKDQGITGTDDDVRTNTKILGKKLDKLNMGGKRDGDGNLIKPTNTGADEEEDSDRTKALKKVFSPLTKSFNVVSKSITGFIGGMAKTVTGGASLFLKGIITASVLGLIIKFLQSDYFKDFLSEENLNKLADFFKNMGVYMNQLFDYLADKTNPLSIAFAIAAGAGIFLAGGLIAKIVGGVVGTFKFLRTLGTLFGIGGALSATSTAAGATSATAVKGLGIAGILKGLGIAALIAVVIKGLYEGIKSGQSSYMEGNDFKKVVADGVANAVTLGFFPNAAKKISEFLSPTAEGKISNLEKELKILESGTGTVKVADSTGRGIVEKSRDAEIERVKKLIAEQKKQAIIDKKEKNETAMLRKNEEDYKTNLNKFLAEENAKLIESGKSGFIDPMQQSHDIKKMEQFTKQFEKEFGVSPMTKKDIAETKADLSKKIKEKIQTNSAFAMIGAGNPEFEKRITGLSQSDLTNDFLKDKRMEIINNIVNSNQIDNSKSEIKINQSKSATPSIREEYILSST